MNILALDQATRTGWAIHASTQGHALRRNHRAHSAKPRKRSKIPRRRRPCHQGARWRRTSLDLCLMSVSVQFTMSRRI